jgi:hypothetical protein
MADHELVVGKFGAGDTVEELIVGGARRSHALARISSDPHAFRSAAEVIDVIDVIEAIHQLIEGLAGVS